MLFRIKLEYSLLLIFILIIFSSNSINSVSINEVMYNPIGSDNNKEFVEFYLDYNDNSEEFTNYILGDSNSNDSLEILKQGNSNYVLVVEEGFYYEELNDSNITIYSAGSSIGNNLNNNEDCIFLYDNYSVVIDSYCYDGSLGNDNNYSIEFYNNSWYEGGVLGGTPGRNNSFKFIEENLSNSTANNSIEVEIDEGNRECINLICGDEITNDIEILEVYSDSGTVDFDKMLKVKLRLSKGNSRKTVVYIYLYDKREEKKVSEEQKVYLLDKYIRFEAIIFLPLKKYSCTKDDFSPKDLVLKIEGLDKEDSIDLDNIEFRDYCKEKLVCIDKSLSKKALTPSAFISKIKDKNTDVEINSFYTRSKKFSNNIKLFSNIDFKTRGNYSISIFNNGTICYNEDFEAYDEIKDTFEFYCNITKGENNYNISIISNGTPNNSSKAFYKYFDIPESKVHEKKNESKDSYNEIMQLKTYSDYDNLTNVNEITGKMLDSNFSEDVIFDKNDESEKNIWLYLVFVGIIIVFIIIFYRVIVKKK